MLLLIIASQVNSFPVSDSEAKEILNSGKSIGLKTQNGMFVCLSYFDSSIPDGSTIETAVNTQNAKYCKFLAHQIDENTYILQEKSMKNLYLGHSESENILGKYAAIKNEPDALRFKIFPQGDGKIALYDDRDFINHFEVKTGYEVDTQAQLNDNPDTLEKHIKGHESIFGQKRFKTSQKKTNMGCASQTLVHGRHNC